MPLTPHIRFTEIPVGYVRKIHVILVLANSAFLRAV